MSGPHWAARERVLLRGGTIHSPGNPFATAMLVDGDTVAWLGEGSAADSYRGAVDRVIDLDGRLVTPGFVDAHVHATSTGLTLTGLDLTRVASLADALRLIETRARHLHGAAMIGHGWDETRWPEQRPPTREELDRASWGSVVYLSRVDVHSAVVSSALLASVPGARTLPGFDEVGALSRQAHHAVREAALAAIGPRQRDDAQRTMRRHCASLGIVAVHEMAGPAISGADDAAALLRLADQEPGPLVTLYWGQLAELGGVEQALTLGARGAAGDLFVDGSIGSHTACLERPYADAETTGTAYLTAEQATAHVVAATRAGLQAGFHVIGDAAAATVMAGFRGAAAELGEDHVRAIGHRIEHAELLSDADIAGLASLGIVASMQPMFDGLWGGAGGMYEQRLGPRRMMSMNRVADLLAAGVVVAFGSDAPVTSVGPWEAIRAAVHHTNPAQRVSEAAAFSAHTRAGWRSAGDLDAGDLMPGAPAHYAVWDAREMSVRDLDGAIPTCDLTAVSGRVVHDRGTLG